jgi:hypothetical protein
MGHFSLYLRPRFDGAFLYRALLSFCHLSFDVILAGGGAGIAASFDHLVGAGKQHRRNL